MFSNLQSFSTGTGGGPNVYNDLCLLPKNVITQKFYSFWFMWIVGLVIISALMLIVRFAIIFDKKTRKIILYKWYEGKAETGVSVLNYAYNKDISKFNANSNGADNIKCIFISFREIL